MMKIAMRHVLIGALSAAVLVGCGPNGEITRAEQGAVIGTIAGAVVGKNTGDKDHGHMVAGAVLGGITGAALGNYMDQQESALRQQLQGTGVQVQRQNDNIVLTMPDAITFDFARSDVKPQFYGVLNNLGATLNQYPQTRIQIAGHTDDVGSDASNMQLSQARASSVRSYLASVGVDAARMQAVGYGESRPIADNSTDYGRAQNRRVEITLIPIQQQ